MPGAIVPASGPRYAAGMYAEFFGLKQDPFSIAPDPRYLFMSERHREALAHLLYGVQGGGGFVLLTGEIGTGKTTINNPYNRQIFEIIARQRGYHGVTIMTAGMTGLPGLNFAAFQVFSTDYPFYRLLMGVVSLLVFLAVALALQPLLGNWGLWLAMPSWLLGTPKALLISFFLSASRSKGSLYLV